MIKNKPRLHDQALIELRTLKKFDEVDPDHSNHVVCIIIIHFKRLTSSHMITRSG